MDLGPASNSSIPFHLARAYGMKAASPMAPLAPLAPVTPVTPTSGPAQTRPLGRIGGADTAPVLPRGDAIDQLVGAVVPGKVDFSGATPVQRAGNLPFYSRPGEVNEAATALRLGRSLDIEG